MVNLQNLPALFLLTGTASAFPRFFQGNVRKQAAAYPYHGGIVSNGILYLTTTAVVTVPAHQSSAVPSPAPNALSPALASPVAALTTLIASQVASSSPGAVATTSAISIPTSAIAPSSVQAAPSPEALSQTASSAPTPSPAAPSPLAVSNVGSLDAATIESIMPSSGSCSGAPFPDECRTAAQAAPFISAAFTKYNINSKAAQAANLALMAIESGEFKYSHSHYPAPVPGKGTRNMQSADFNNQYATQLAGADKVQAAGNPDAVLALVNGDADSFASASWYLATKCPTVLQQFSTNVAGAWTAYIGPDCIGTTDSDEREKYWAAAKKALGVS